MVHRRIFISIFLSFCMRKRWYVNYQMLVLKFKKSGY
eukprot:UN13493